jgi:hypothetical protein
LRSAIQFIAAFATAAGGDGAVMGIVFNHLLSVSGTHDCGYSRIFKKPSLFFV